MGKPVTVTLDDEASPREQVPRGGMGMALMVVGKPVNLEEAETRRASGQGGKNSGRRSRKYRPVTDPQKRRKKISGRRHSFGVRSAL